MSIESVMLSNHLIFCCSLLLSSIFPSIRVFSNELALPNQVAKVLKLQLQQQSFQWIFRIDFLQYWLIWYLWSPRDSQEFSHHHSSKASILQHSAFFTVQLSHSYMTTGKIIALTIQTFVGKVMYMGEENGISKGIYEDHISFDYV